MVDWKNLDTLTSFKKLQQVEKVNLAQSMQAKAEQSVYKSTVFPWRRGLPIIMPQSRWTIG